MNRIIKTFSIIITVSFFAALFVLGANAKYSNGQLISFGSYPQVRITTENTVANLDGVDKVWTSYGFFGEDEEATMFYCDFEYNSAKYRAVKIDSCRSYAQQKNGYASGKTYYFRFAPIQWRVLDVDKGLVWSTKIIDTSSYNNSRFLNEDDSLYYKTSDYSTLFSSWADSEVRAWLNDEFFRTAFSEKEKKSIKETELVNCGATDRVFLLSREEYNNSALKYEPGTNPTTGRTTVPPTPSVYSLAMGFKNPYMEYPGDPYALENQTLLRSEGDDADINICHVRHFIDKSRYENASFSTEPHTGLLGIRPALRLCNANGLGQSCDEHGKEFIEIRSENVVNATCEEGGCHDYVVFCTECEKEIYRETIIDEPLGHNYKLINNNSIYCNSGLPVIYRCTRCGDEYTDENPTLRHTFENYVSNNDATCLNDGTRTAKCRYCDAERTITDSGTKLEHEFTDCVQKGRFESERNDELYDGSLKWKYVEGRQYKHCSRCNRDYPRYPIGFYARVSGPWAKGIGLFNNSPNYYRAEYTGKPVTLDFELYMEIANEYIPLVEGKDYTVKYKNNTAPGYGVALLEFDNEYISGTCGMNMRILAELPNVRLIMDGTNLTLKWDPIVGSPNLNISLYKCGDWENQTIKTTNKNYITFENVVPNESYQVQFWMDDKGLLFKRSFSFHTNEFECEKAVYTGKEIEPAITVKNSEGEILTENEDYTIKFSNNKNVGIAKATIKMKSSPNVPESEINTYEVLFRILPQKVKGLKTSAAGKDSLKLSWNKVTGAEKYMLYQSTDGSSWSRIKTVTGNTASISGLKTGQTYQYKVRAYAVSGYGKYSSVLKAQTKTAAPTKLTVSAVSKTSIKLSWKTVFGASKYSVYQSSDGKTWSKVKTVASSSASVTGLTAGKKYQFKVVSVGLCGNSAFSEITKTQTLTDAPAIGKLTSTKAKTATVTWGKVTGAKSYIVYKSDDGKTFKAVKTGVTKTSYTITDLKPGKKVYVKIIAVNADGAKSAGSAVKSVTVKK